MRVAAEAALSAKWGAPVFCSIVDTRGDKGRSRVYRLSVSGGLVGSVILKACVGDEGAPYIAGDATPGGPFQRLCNEWAGGEILGPLGLGPNIYAADIERGFCLMEDLGGGESLAQRLTGDDPASATEALFSFARSLGDLHAANSGYEKRWAKLLADKGTGSGNNGQFASPTREDAEAFKVLCETIAITVPAGLEAELTGLFDALDRPGGYWAFTPADRCPDNHFLRGDRVVFFDCERASVRHALLDVAYLLAPFPTCWCCAALPDGLPERLLMSYRERFVAEPDFDDQLTLALAAWFLRTIRPRRISWLETDQQWGLSSFRQRIRACLKTLLARPNLTSVAPKLAEVLADIDRLFQSRWTDLTPMPPYPAFA